MLDIPLHETERLLRTSIAELGGTVEAGVELTSLTDEGSGVIASVVERRSTAQHYG